MYNLPLSQYHTCRMIIKMGGCLTNNIKKIKHFFLGQHDGLLLDDSGYPCRRFLLTPFLNPSNDAENRFNQSLCRTRVRVEQTFGILKMRFQCLHHEMATEPPPAAVYVVACAVLHIC